MAQPAQRGRRLLAGVDQGPLRRVGADMLGEEVDDCDAERVVVVTRHHVPCAGDVDERRAGNSSEELLDRVVGDDVGLRAADEHGRRSDPAGGGVEPVRHLVHARLERHRILVDVGPPRHEPRVPPPPPATVRALRQHPLEACGRSRRVAVRVVRRDGGRCLVEGREPVGVRAHEVHDPRDPAEIHARCHIDQHDSAEQLLSRSALGEEGAHPTHRRADHGGRLVEGSEDDAQVAGEELHVVVAARRPVTVAVTTGIHRHHVVAGGGEARRRALPRVPALTATVEQEHR